MFEECCIFQKTGKRNRARLKLAELHLFDGKIDAREQRRSFLKDFLNVFNHEYRKKINLRKLSLKNRLEIARNSTNSVLPKDCGFTLPIKKTKLILLIVQYGNNFCSSPLHGR